MARHLTPSLIALLALTGCSQPADDASAPEPGDTDLLSAPLGIQLPEPQADRELTAWQRAYFDFCLGQTVALREAASQLDTATQRLAEAPSADSLTAARNAWQTGLTEWGQLSPCVASSLAPQLDAPHRQLRLEFAAGPALPGYIDTVPGYPESGLVFDQTVAATRDALRHQHQLTDPAEISLGLYAIEVILFGVDASRNVSDFHQNEPLAERRHPVLAVQTAHLADIAADWGTYLTRAEASAPASTAIRSVIADSFETIMTQLQNSSRERRGKALLSAHDQIALEARVASLVEWAQLPATREWVGASGLDVDLWQTRWQAVAGMEPDAATMARHLQAVWPLLQQLG